MLVLSRKKQESVMVGGGRGEQLLKVTVIDIRGGSVRLGFDANADLPVHRTEVWERICAESPKEQAANGESTKNNK